MFKNIESKVGLDQSIKKLDAVGAFIAQIIFLIIIAFIFGISFILMLFIGFSVVSFLGKVFGTIVTANLLSSKKN